MTSQSVTDKSLSNQAKNKYFYEVTRTRNDYYKNLFAKHRNNMKATWKAMNKLLGKNKKLAVSYLL